MKKENKRKVSLTKIKIANLDTFSKLKIKGGSILPNGEHLPWTEDMNTKDECP